MKKILIYNSGGGLGDSIQLFSLIISFQRHFKGCKFYYLGAHENHFLNSLKEYNIKIKTLDLGIKYFGFRWWHYFIVKKKFNKLKIEKFNLIIDLQSKLRNTLILRKIPCDNFYSATYNFGFCSISKKYVFSFDITEMTIKNIGLLTGSKIKKIEYDLDLINEKFTKEAKRLLPNRSYVGFSITQGNEYRKKGWPIENFIELARKIKLKNKVPIFFVKKTELKLIDKIKSGVPNALFPEHKSNLTCPALVTALSKRLDVMVSIDNGIMHMAALSGVSMIVLFGPTSSEKFAPKIKQIKILDSKELYKTDDISKIGVNEVFYNI